MAQSPSPFQSISGLSPLAAYTSYVGSRTPVGGPTLGRPSAARAFPAPKPPGTPAGGSPAPQPQQAAAPAAPADPYQGISYSADPILAQIRLLGQNSVPDAVASADAAKKQALISAGFGDVANNTVFGGKGFTLPGIAGLGDFTIPDTTHVGDQATAQAATQNPFSTAAQLARAHTEQVHNLDEGLNQQGLYYSGYRGKQLGDEQTNYQQHQADALTALGQLLSQIDTGVQAAYQSEGSRQMQAEQDAYLRSVAAAAAGQAATTDTGTAGGAGDTGGAPYGPSPDQLAAVYRDPALYAVSRAALRQRTQASSPGGRGGV